MLSNHFISLSTRIYSEILPEFGEQTSDNVVKKLSYTSECNHKPAKKANSRSRTISPLQHIVTVSGARIRFMICRLLVHKSNQYFERISAAHVSYHFSGALTVENPQNLWFEQDGGTASREPMNLFLQGQVRLSSTLSCFRRGIFYHKLHGM